MTKFDRSARAGMIGAITGCMIGTVGSVLHSGGRVSKATAPAAMMMATVLGIGAVLKQQ